MVLTDLTVDLAIIRLLCVGIFLGQACSQVRVDVCSRHRSELVEAGMKEKYMDDMRHAEEIERLEA